MGKNIGTFFILFCIAGVLTAGCTTPVSTNATPMITPTPQIVYVTVLVTPTPSAVNESPSVAPGAAEPREDPDVKMDEAFLDYTDGNQIYEAMTRLESARPGSYSISTGYNAKPKEEADRLTGLIFEAPKPASEKMKAYRSAMMDALSEMDGTTAGFTRYRDAMEKVILAKNAAESEMHSAGSSVVDAIHFIGTGNAVRSFNVTETGPKVFTLHHTGDRNFAITLKDDNGKYIALLVNEIGDYSGKNSEQLAVGKYWLTINADGEWTIAITSG